MAADRREIKLTNQSSWCMDRVLMNVNVFRSSPSSLGLHAGLCIWYRCRKVSIDRSMADEEDLCLCSQDLTYAEGGHNWRSIIFSLLVIGFVIAGIVTAIYLLGWVSFLSSSLSLFPLSLDFLPVVFPMDTPFIQIHEINPAGSDPRFFFLSSRSFYINGCEGKSTWKYHWENFFKWDYYFLFLLFLSINEVASFNFNLNFLELWFYYSIIKRKIARWKMSGAN